MARMKDNHISGAVGPAIFYIVNGVDYIRTKPGKQTKKRGQKTKPHRQVFGIVSRNGSFMMKVLKTGLLLPFNLATYNAARGWMRNQYNDHAETPNWDIGARPNDTCQLNPLADLRDHLFAPVTIADKGQGRISVQFPALNLAKDIKKMPAGTAAVNFKMVLLHSSFPKEFKAPPYMQVEQYSIPNNQQLQPAKEIILATTCPEPVGNIAIVVLAIELENMPNAGTLYNTNTEWLPAAILGMGRLKG